MKKIIHLFLLAICSLQAQDFVKVEYDKEILWRPTLKENANADDRKWHEAQLKELNRKRYSELIATRTEAEFKMVERISNDQKDEDSGYTVSMSFGNSEPVYMNAATNMFAIEKNTYNKNILVSDSAKMYDWKLTREKKKLFGLPVKKAIKTDSAGKMTAEIWVATKLPFRFGPDKIMDTPGLVLDYTQYDDGEPYLKYSATAITFPESLTIDKPTKGKKMTEKEYYDWLDKANEKRMKMYSGGVDTSD